MKGITKAAFICLGLAALLAVMTSKYVIRAFQRDAHPAFIAGEVVGTLLPSFVFLLIGIVLLVLAAIDRRLGNKIIDAQIVDDPPKNPFA